MEYKASQNDEIQRTKALISIANSLDALFNIVKKVQLSELTTQEMYMKGFSAALDTLSINQLDKVVITMFEKERELK